MSYFKIPREQTNHENCVAHNGNAIPIPGRDVLVQSWYQGGMSVIDWTNGNKVEGARLVRPRADRLSARGSCSAASGRSYYYNGFIYGSEIQRGFDVFKADGQRGLAGGPLQGPHAERADAVQLR